MRRLYYIVCSVYLYVDVYTTGFCRLRESNFIQQYIYLFCNETFCVCVCACVRDIPHHKNFTTHRFIYTFAHTHTYGEPSSTRWSPIHSILSIHSFAFPRHPDASKFIRAHCPPNSTYSSFVSVLCMHACTVLSLAITLVYFCTAASFFAGQ